MAKYDFNVIVSKETVAITNAGFGKLLLIDKGNDIPLTEIKNAHDINELEVGEDNKVKTTLENIFKQSLVPESVLVIGTGAEGDLVEAFKEVVAEDNDFFYVALVQNDLADLKKLAPVVTGHDKILGLTVATVEDGEAVKTAVDEDRQELLVIGVHEDANAQLGQLLVAKAAGVNPGGATFKFQNIVGLEASKFANQKKQLHEKGLFTYKKEQKRLMTSEGITASGEYLDVVVGKYFVKTRIEEEASELAYTRANAGSKIPYTDDGIAMLVGVVSGVGDESIENQLIDSYSIDFKRKREMSVKDRADRFYNGIRATFILQGAIHEAEFHVNLAY